MTNETALTQLSIAFLKAEAKKTNNPVDVANFQTVIDLLKKRR